MQSSFERDIQRQMENGLAVFVLGLCCHSSVL